MWNKPWTLKEGLIICGGLIVTGLMLQLSVGPVIWDLFDWPVNGFVFVSLILINIGIYLLRGRVYGCRFLSTYRAAVPALGFAVALTIIMGLTRQTVNGKWFNNMLTFWPFILIYVYITIILAQVVIYHIIHFRWQRDIPFLLNHLGLFIAITTATLGNADMQRLKIITTIGTPEWRAIGDNGMIKELPIAIELKKFIMEEYDDGTPKRFASEIQILTKTCKNILTTVDVNKPSEVDGWKIYQYGYDTAMGKMSNTSILELVSDPWLPMVYTGIYMMLAGAIAMFILGVRRNKS